MQQAPQRQPQEVRTPLPPQEKGPPVSNPGFYVAAHAGYGRARDANFREDNPGGADCFLVVSGPTCGASLESLDSSPVFGVSVGYRFTPMFRVEVSYQRRDDFNLSGWDPAGTYFDPPVKSDAGMVSGFIDFPYWIGGRVQPFAGVGVGRTRNKMDALRWNDPSCCTGVLNDGGSNNDTAWQVTLGAAFAITRNWILDFAYRYTDLGEFKKAAGPDQVNIFNATGTTGAATGKLRINEVLFNLRYEFN